MTINTYAKTSEATGEIERGLNVLGLNILANETTDPQLMGELLQDIGLNDLSSLVDDPQTKKNFTSIGKRCCASR